MTRTREITAARGKLGVLLVGLGAVATTTIAGVPDFLPPCADASMGTAKLLL